MNVNFADAGNDKSLVQVLEAGGLFLKQYEVASDPRSYAFDPANAALEDKQLKVRRFIVLPRIDVRMQAEAGRSLLSSLSPRLRTTKPKSKERKWRPRPKMSLLLCSPGKPS